MGKGSNTTTSTSSGTSTTSPDANAYQAYLSLLNRASGVASTPYQAFSGEEVAPVNGQQTAGIGTINQATGNIAAAGAPLTAQSIRQYMDPYTQNVIDATQRDFDVQNQRANSTVVGNAAAQGALGGDRVAVAQALTQEAQNRTQAPIIAGLRSSGYQNALQTAENEQRFGVQAGQALMGAGQSQIGAGTLQQNTQQAQDTQARADYYQQQGYPFQVAQWLAAIDTGVGSQMGGTSTTNQTGQTTGPSPNFWSQLLGVGLAGASLIPSDRRVKENIEKIGKTNDGQPIYRFNYKGDHQTQIGLMHDEVEEKHPDATARIKGVGVVDYRKATDSSVERFSGGRIAGFAAGGGPSSPYGSDQTWVPQAGLSMGRGAPAPPQTRAPDAPKQQSGMSKDQLKGLGVLGTDIKNWWQTGEPDVSMSDVMSAPGITADDISLWRGGRIKRYAAGGAPDEELMFEDRFAPVYGGRKLPMAGIGASAPAFDDVVNPNDPIVLDPEADQEWRNRVDRDNGRKIVQAATSQNAPVPESLANNDNQPDIQPDVQPGIGPVAAINKAVKAPAVAEEEPSEALAYGSDRAAPRAVAPSAGVAAPSEDSSFLGRLGIHMTPELRQGLLQAGLAMMATTRGGPGSFLGSLGEAGMAGVGAYSQSQQAARKQALEDLKLKTEMEDRSLKNASSPLIRGPNGEMVVNPAWVKMKEKESEISSEPKTPFGWQVDDKGVPHYVPGGPADPEYAKKLAEARAKIPFGWRQEEDGNIVPIPGGPADPNYIRNKTDATTKEKWTPAGWLTTKDGAIHPISQDQSSGRLLDNITKQAPTDSDKITPRGAPKGPTLSDYDAQALARYVVSTGDEGAVRNATGVNAENKGLVQKYINEERSKNNVDDAEYARRKQDFAANGISKNAAARTRATREENLNLILKATAAAVPAALEESDKVSRMFGVVPLDRIIQKGEIITNDENLITFGMANLQLAEHWARAMNPTGVMRESDRDKALHFLDTALSKGAYKTAVMQLQKQITRERDSIREGKETAADRGQVQPGDTGSAKANLSDEDQKALDWAKNNPNDPRAAAIKKKLGVE